MEALGTPRGAVLLTMATMVRPRHTYCDIMMTLQQCRKRDNPQRREQRLGPAG